MGIRGDHNGEGNGASELGADKTFGDFVEGWR